jgi:DNA-binding MarR family transcriptional regulator
MPSNARPENPAQRAPSTARPENPAQRAPNTAYEGPEESPGYLLWRATLLWQRTVRDALAPHELTHVQFVILTSGWWLAEHGLRPTQKDIAAHAATDQMMASQVLRRLETKGLVSRVPDPGDTRAMIVALTREGRARLTAALPDVEAADEAFFSALEGDRSRFIADLVQLSRTEGR